LRCFLTENSFINRENDSRGIIDSFDWVMVDDTHAHRSYRF